MSNYDTLGVNSEIDDARFSFYIRAVPRLRLVTFDLDNTLWPALEVILAAEQECSAWLVERYPEHARGLEGEALRDVRSQLLRENPRFRHDLSELRRCTVTRTLIRCGVKEREARSTAELAFEVFHAARNRVRLFDGALDTLRQLGRRYTLGALTNGNADLVRIGIADFFSFHHSAESIGNRKPAPDMFHAAVDSAGVRCQECVHVGDHPLEDVQAARDAGFHAVWANLHDAEWPAELAPPEHTIESLSQLVDLIERVERRQISERDPRSPGV